MTYIFFWKSKLFGHVHYDILLHTGSVANFGISTLGKWGAIQENFCNYTS